MEVPSIVPGNDEKRRVEGVPERRADKHRHHLCRRNHHDRRYDRLGRFLVSVFHTCGLHGLEEQVRSLSERRLLGPVITFISAVVFFLLYSGEKGVLIAGAMLFALMVHEAGHFIATINCNLRPHWWWFWPFLGALMRLASIKTRNQEAAIAFGGPLLGGISSAVTFGLWVLFPNSGYLSTVLYQLALVQTVVNLFNLIPLSPLDGGRITQASHHAFQWFGFAVLLVVSWFFRQPTLLLVWIVIAIDRFLDYPVWRFVTALCFLFGMAFLMGFGYGDQSVPEGVTYVCFGFLLVVMCRPNQEAYLRRQKNGKKSLPQLPPGKRIAWGVSWIVLTSLLAILFWAELMYGPTIVPQ